LARYIVENKQADYCFTVKDNQKTLKEDIATFSLTENFPPSPSNL
jgi:predicted transposase YbfD/YdcC